MDIMSLLGFGKSKSSPKPASQERKGGFKIAVSSGLYTIARGEELQTLVKKVGYALTRGSATIEISSDIPHEIDYSEGKEIRYIAQHQGIELTLHGDLAVAFEMPDKTEWVNAQDKFQKSIKSAVYGGCTYVNFHSCLREWLELFTYAGQRLEIVMCDHLGRVIAELFKDDKKLGGKLADWFVSTSLGEDTPENRFKRKYDFALRYGQYIIGPDEYEKVRNNAYQKALNEILSKAIQSLNNRTDIDENEKQRIKESLENPMVPLDYRFGIIRNYNLISEKEISDTQRRELREALSKEIREKISDRWYEEELRGGTLDDVYIIMAHYLFLTKDSLWEEMIKIYDNVVNYHPDLKYNPDDMDWLLKIWDRAQTVPTEWSLKFKEFYYGVVAAKYLQGHIIKAIEWMNDEKAGLKKIIKEELAAIVKDDKLRMEEEKKLFEVLKNMKICFENPDARNAELGGRYMLWHPKQIYLAVKHTRKELEKKPETKSHSDKIFMIIDWEHVATQGVDPFHEADDFVFSMKKLGDNNAGQLIIGIHANYPSPLQPHKPIEIADRPVIYNLLYKIREIGLGKTHMTYLLFERGGGENPFKGSIIALRAIANELEKDTKPDELPPTFYGLPEGTGDYARQRVIIREHAVDPLKGMLKVPEEDYTFLGTAAIKGGKRPEEWKKEELK